MAERNEVKDKLLEAIMQALEKYQHPSQLLRLAESYAWIVSPSQSHGGGNGDSKT